MAMARYLDEIDFVDITGTADRASLTQAGIRYHRPEDGGRSRIATWNLLRLLDRLAPDVIVCHYGSGDHFFSAIAWGRCPVAVIAMGSDVLYGDGDTRVSTLRALLTRMGLRRAAFISAKSRFIAAALERLGVKCRVDINYWGSDLNRFRPGDSAAARRQLGLPATGPLFLSPRAIEPLYNIQLIVEAFAEVVRVRPDARLAIIGRSVPGYLAVVTETIGRLGLGDRVRVVGEVPFPDLPAWYQASDGVVSMANAEGFPNTVLEVMACGVPVLVGNIPQVRELLVDGVNASLCAIDQPAITSGLLQLLQTEVADLLSVRGRETALEAGDIAANGQRFATELRTMADSGRRPGFLGLLPFRTLMLFSRLF